MTHNLIRKLQKMFHAENSVDSVQSEERFGPFRNLLNVRYGNTYPNSTMDIYLCEENAPDHPVLFYVHGGGYTWGDKRSGDPNGEGLPDWERSVDGTQVLLLGNEQKMIGDPYLEADRILDRMQGWEE